jgi:hypothetical protein
MKIQQSLIMISAALFLLSPLAQADDIWGEDGDFMEDDSNAKVQKYTAKQRAREANMTPEERAAAKKNQDASCGSVDIGNVQGGGRNVDNVVIIKGDVINANNKCR